QLPMSMSVSASQKAALYEWTPGQTPTVVTETVDQGFIRINGWDWFGSDLYVLYTDQTSKCHFAKIESGNLSVLSSNVFQFSSNVVAVGPDQVWYGAGHNLKFYDQ